MVDADDSEIVADLIRAVQTLAQQVLTLHLQLGAVRTILVRHGMVTEAGLEATFAGLEAASAADEVLNRQIPTVDEVFNDLLRRLGKAA
jgi:hypothetical protein